MSEVARGCLSGPLDRACMHTHRVGPLPPQRPPQRRCSHVAPRAPNVAPPPVAAVAPHARKRLHVDGSDCSRPRAPRAPRAPSRRQVIIDCHASVCDRESAHSMRLPRPSGVSPVIQGRTINHPTCVAQTQHRDAQYMWAPPTRNRTSSRRLKPQPSFHPAPPIHHPGRPSTPAITYSRYKTVSAAAAAAPASCVVPFVFPFCATSQSGADPNAASNYLLKLRSTAKASRALSANFRVNRSHGDNGAKPALRPGENRSRSPSKPGSAGAGRGHAPAACTPSSGCSKGRYRQRWRRPCRMFYPDVARGAASRWRTSPPGGPPAESRFLPACDYPTPLQQPRARQQCGLTTGADAVHAGGRGRQSARLLLRVQLLLLLSAAALGAPGERPK
jgi:hypothetical protein